MYKWLLWTIPGSKGHCSALRQTEENVRVSQRGNFPVIVPRSICHSCFLWLLELLMWSESQICEDLIYKMGMEPSQGCLLFLILNNYIWHSWSSLSSQVQFIFLMFSMFACSLRPIVKVWTFCQEGPCVQPLWQVQ